MWVLSQLPTEVKFQQTIERPENKIELNNYMNSPPSSSSNMNKIVIEDKFIGGSN